MLITVVVPVLKNKTGDVGDMNNYRPISLATILAKVFDALLNVHLQNHLVLHGNQFGFRPNLSTESAILSLKHTVRYYTDRQTPVYACFLDLSKAFDLVSYDILWGKLTDIDLPHELVTIFQYWYSHQVNNVRWAGVISESFGMECGVRQGGLTSPSLFNLYVDALIVALSKQHVGCHVDGVCVNNLSYADDMVLLSASVCGLRKLLRICEDYAMSHGLKYNVPKSKYMVFAAGSKRPDGVPPIRLYGVPLDRVEHFKYLGHVLTPDLKDCADIERERRALSIRANMLARRFARCSQNVKITLFRAFCTSLYTCSLWANYTQKSIRALQVQYNNALRAVLGLPRYCSASGMFAWARTDCFHATVRKRCASLVRRVRASPNTVLAMIANKEECHLSCSPVTHALLGSYLLQFHSNHRLHSSSILLACDPDGAQRLIPPHISSISLQPPSPTGRLSCSLVTHALLGSYLLQAELGDAECEVTGSQMLRHRVAPPRALSKELEEKINDLYAMHKGQNPAEAVLNYLENAKKLPLYGAELHCARDADDVDLVIGVCAGGISIYRDGLLMNRFPWAKLTKISYNKKCYTLKLRPSEFDEFETSLSFRLPATRACKKLWRCSVEHHMFFRRAEAVTVEKVRLFPRLGSRRLSCRRTLRQLRADATDQRTQITA
ncbi:unnamed protein product [Plutella xylostella]|uniref:(diamondback moth) hypothetical protein n=1 Tax=Plutella xylostella TaxID=51655 RepID=A0A8S4FSD6_PLUXY|nr:unnamed protein product [Plutella xylostella]